MHRHAHVLPDGADIIGTARSNIGEYETEQVKWIVCQASRFVGQNNAEGGFDLNSVATANILETL